MRQSIEKDNPSRAEDFAYIMGAVKNALGLSESVVPKRDLSVMRAPSHPDFHKMGPGHGVVNSVYGRVSLDGVDYPAGKLCMVDWDDDGMGVEKVDHLALFTKTSEEITTTANLAPGNIARTSPDEEAPHVCTSCGYASSTDEGGVCPKCGGTMAEKARWIRELVKRVETGESAAHVLNTLLR